MVTRQLAKEHTTLSNKSFKEYNTADVYIYLYSLYFTLLYYITQMDITYTNVHEYVRLEVNPFLFNPAPHALN